MKTSEGFQVTDSRNLPKVDHLMLMQYMHENECYNVAETRSAKALLASREAYVESAIGFVEIKCEGNLCTVKCRVTPEHKIKGKLYPVTAVIDENSEKILKLECTDCAASAGGCKHAICFALWLIKRTDEPAVTSVTCYWTKLPGAVNEQRFILAKNIGKSKSTLEDVQMNVSLSMFTEECKRQKVTSGLILNYCSYRQPILNEFSVLNLMLQFILKVNQADSKVWHCLRLGRVTGSRIYEAVHCQTENGALVQNILGGYKLPETKAMKRGRILEKQVLEELEKFYNLKINNSGFILINPIIGVILVFIR
ncbi:uncharacterized protein LOC128681925 [Plodia interpunctella]|uniref:uncharacterized protein LOC128681925 n=1 Tax=Plodia interpunctella TaxID=58824 RepID=UPI002367C97E|nr:uncharacterized protein LOC128681925 [Plodia interpunctella]